MTEQLVEPRSRETNRVSRILIVDDDPNIVQMLSDILTDEGYEVATATQSLRAFDRAKEAQPDLILMDIMMPYLDGLDQIKLLSLDDDLKDIPIIVITAKARALEGIDDLRALRIVDYLYKPFEISDLLEKIGKALKDRAK
ncbi:MAG TPA: response regulator [Chloroflexota bacterium]|nr:response regulator [Chloroflexota bacterium]